MPDSTIQQIKDRLDIIDVVSGYLKLEKTGINFRAPCPFHGEKKPSFFVSPTRQMFKCFGCGVSGSMFDFIMQIEGIEFVDSLRILARRAGVELKGYNPELQTKRQRLYSLCELACAFFEKQLNSSSTGKLVENYLYKRKILPETIKQWRIGYAPDSWRTLSDFLVSRGYQREEIVEAGLAVKSDKSQTPYDRFRGRIMFPVFDLNSQVIGFGGRVFDENPNKKLSEEQTMAKYLNIPNTPLYDKSQILYGLNFAKVDIRKSDGAIITEGYMDVITSHQAGFTSTVASSGTALTEQQLRVLKRYTNNLFTAFDMDSAGGLATFRGIDMALRQDFNVKVIAMEKDKDPADVISQNATKWQKAIEESKEIMAFYFDSTLDKFDKQTPQGKKDIANVLLPQIKKIPNYIVKNHWVQKLSNILNVSEQSISQELGNIKETTKKNIYNVRTPAAQPINVLEIKDKTRRNLLVEKMISSLLQHKESKEIINDDVLSVCPSYAVSILCAIKDGTEESLDKASGQVLNDCVFQSEVEISDKPEEEVMLCSSFLAKLSLKDKLSNISNKIKVAEQAGDAETLNILIQEFNELAKQSKV